MPRLIPRNVVVDAETKGWVRALVRSEMAKRGLTYRDLAGLLTAEGLGENEGNLRSKVSRGELSGAAMLAALYVMGCKIIKVQELPSSHDPDPEDRPTLDNAFQNQLVRLVSRDDEAGLYKVTIGDLRTEIEIRLERRTPAGDTMYFLSHTIQAGNVEPSATACMGFSFSPAKSLQRALDHLTNQYSGGVSAGVKPSEDWLRRCPKLPGG